MEEQITALVRGEALPETPAEPADTVETDTTEPDTLEQQASEEEESQVEDEGEAENDLEPRLYAGRYKTVEELERAYSVEAQAVITRQGAELTELRGLKDQFESLRTELTKPAGPQYDPSGIEDELAMQPHLAPSYAQQALENGDNVLWGKAMSAWYQVDPVGATAFQTNAHIRVAQDQFEQRLAPIQQSTQRAETAAGLAAAFEALQAEHPDFSEVMNGITQDQLAGFPKIVVAQLEASDPNAKREALETLYRWNKAEQVGNIANATAAAAAATAAEAVQARQDAVVATTNGSADRVPVTKTPIEQFHDQFENSMAFRKAAGLA